MKSIKKMAAIMILAAMATLSTPQAFAGHMLGDATRTGNERNGHMLGDRTGHMLGDIVGIILTDIVGHMLGD